MSTALAPLDARPSLVAQARLAAQAGLVDIAIEDGTVAAIRPSTGAPLPPGAVDAGGRAVTPAFAESHLHLDKALLGTPPDATRPDVTYLAGAIAATSRLKTAFTREDVRERAACVLRSALRSGTTAIRAQTEVDPGIGLLGVETIAQLAADLGDTVRVQLAIFPQEGILTRPGTLDLMREGLRLPGSAIGACPYAEPTVEDARRHVDLVLDLAVELDRGVDLHLDLADSPDDPRFALAAYVAEATKTRHLEGRVAISHASTLGALDDDRRARTLDALAQARVTVVMLPATDLFLNGRTTVPQVRGLPILRELWSRGVPVTVSSNNVRNPFTPTGRASLLDMALLLARTSHLATAAELEEAVAMASSHARALLWPDEPAGLTVGASADLVVLDAPDPAAAAIADPARLCVLSRGRVVATEVRVSESVLAS